jgi:hypothetical protein
LDEVWPRLRVVFARRSPVAAVFRRGPSRWTLVLRWDTRTDELTAGDWLHGRLYEEWSDLSPDGRLLVYFAANFSPRPQPWALESHHFRAGGHPGSRPAWTALSVLPHLQPIGLWTKSDCWGGGGSFPDDDTVELSDLVGLAHQEIAPRAVRVSAERLTPARRVHRRGWVHRSDDDAFVKARPNGTPGEPQTVLERRLAGVGRAEEWALLEPDGTRRALTGLDWVDFDQRGRLVAALEGRVVHLQVQTCGIATTTIADLNPYHR